MNELIEKAIPETYRVMLKEQLLNDRKGFIKYLKQLEKPKDAEDHIIATYKKAGDSDLYYLALRRKYEDQIEASYMRSLLEGTEFEILPEWLDCPKPADIPIMERAVRHLDAYEKVNYEIYNGS